MGFNFTLVPSVDFAYVMSPEIDLHGIHGCYIVSRFSVSLSKSSFLSHNVCAVGLQKKQGYVILFIARRLRLEADSVLVRNFAPSLWRAAKRWRAKERSRAKEKKRGHPGERGIKLTSQALVARNK